MGVRYSQLTCRSLDKDTMWSLADTPGGRVNTGLLIVSDRRVAAFRSASILHNMCVCVCVCVCVHVCIHDSVCEAEANCATHWMKNWFGRIF